MRAAASPRADRTPARLAALLLALSSPLLKPGLPVQAAPVAPPGPAPQRPLQVQEPVQVPVPLKLNAEQQRVHDASMAAVRADPDAWIRRYLLHSSRRVGAGGQLLDPGSDNLAAVMRRGPLTINVDDARDLFPAYAADRQSRSLHADSVHEASLLISELLWERALNQAVGRRDLVLFTGGGAASGKTWALRHSPEVQALMPRVQIIQDSTMANQRRASQRLQQALASGRSVRVIYVFTPIEQAVSWLVARGMEHGRSLPAAAMARSHWRSQQTVLALADRHRSDPRVRIDLLINRPNAPGRLQPIEDLRRLKLSAAAHYPSEQAFSRHVLGLVHRNLVLRHEDADPADPTPTLEDSLLGDDGS